MAPRNKEEEDRVSKLPDDILVNILNRLPTIDSVRTCVLSKRWVRLWTHITSLHFDLSDYILNDPNRADYKDCYQKFVSMVVFRLASPTIQSFMIDIGDCDIILPIFETCFPHLVNKRLRELCIFCENSYPSSIFSCQTLEDLCLCLFGSFVAFPNFVHLPNLQILELSRCNFFCEENSDISQNIILSFPVLKKLISYSVCWSGFQSVSFEVPLLQRLEIQNHYERDRIECLENYNFSTNPSVTIDSELFEISHCDSEEERMEHGLRACTFLQQYLHINKVKHLELSCTEAIFFAKESFANFSSFNTLRHLKLRKVCGEILVVFLVKSPYLTSLTLQMENVPSSLLSHSYEVVSLNDHAEKLLNYGIVPDCISHALKKFKIENFYGSEEQLKLVEYIMENAQNLELLSVSHFNLFHQSATRKISKKHYCHIRGA